MMAKYLDVELTTGETVRVYSPPTLKLGQLLDKRYPDPEVPIRETTTKLGEVYKTIHADDPEYLAEKAKIEEVRSDKLNELTILACLKDVTVPSDDFYSEFEYLALMADPDWVRRDGKVGMKLDYVEWVLLANVADQVKVQRTLVEMSGIDLDAISSIEESFLGNVERETSEPLDDAGDRDK